MAFWPELRFLAENAFALKRRVYPPECCLFDSCRPSLIVLIGPPLHQSGALSSEELETLAQAWPPPGEWPLHACKLLTAAPLLRLQALRQLVQRAFSQALRPLLDGLDRDDISEDEAVALLSLDKYRALTALAELQRDALPPARRARLTKRLDGRAVLIRPNMWIKCDVGSGQIGLSLATGWKMSRSAIYVNAPIWSALFSFSSNGRTDRQETISAKINQGPDERCPELPQG